MRAFSRAFGDHRWKRIVGVTAAQSGKTATVLDVIGERLDNRPAPILYVGPNKEFLTDQLEPRIEEMFRQAESLGAKVIGGIESKEQKKTLKRVAGVRLRLAHAGSSAALKSDAAALALVDEYDEMMRNIRGQGDPLGLVEARGDTYADFQVGITSTPTQGMVEIVHDDASGLDFWKPGEEDDISSPIWRLWQEGTRHHFCWPCPDCGRYFVPRSKLLHYPKNATPSQALANSWLECPHCGFEIREEHKAFCNANGAFVAPGETIDAEGVISGAPAETTTLSFWISGFCSPFKTIGERAERYLRALASGEQDKIQTAVNAGFGELYLAGGGEVPEWTEVVKMREAYAERVPDDVLFLVAAVDVQGNRLPYVIRGFGAGGTSWLIEHGYIWGPTKDQEVWRRLSEKLTTPIDGRPIKIAFVDSGFRPGKKESLPIHRVYEFCRKHKRFVFATKGSSTPMARPLVESAIEVTGIDGKAKKYGLHLLRLDTDHWKAVVHERLSFERDAPGALRLNDAADDDYCQQLVAEARVKGPSGRWIWVSRYRENHFLDCEAMAAAAAWRVGSDRQKAIKAETRSSTSVSLDPPDLEAAPQAKAPEPIVATAMAQKAIRARFASFAHRLNR
jgi:phage terminase large subunit GpA-like protein